MSVRYKSKNHRNNLGWVSSTRRGAPHFLTMWNLVVDDAPFRQISSMGGLIIKWFHSWASDQVERFRYT